MPDHNTPDPAKLRLTREAAGIFRRLEEQPENSEALRDREAFLARGPSEREVYDRMTLALSAARTGLRPQKSNRLKAGIACVALIAVYFASKPIHTRVVADQYTWGEALETRLNSGDGVSLDASTALIDDSDGVERRITLLNGAAFFKVDRTERRFTVEVGDLTALAWNTAFEVANHGTHVLVTVHDGKVDVRAGDNAWALGPGDRLQWSETEKPQVDTIIPDMTASWNSQKFVVDGMTFAQVAAVIDRRLPGKIVITDSNLAKVRVSGGLDLSDPVQALKHLAAASDATVLAAPPLLTLVQP